MEKTLEFGYCRISTPKQNIARQERNIVAEYPGAHIVKEIYTGRKVQGRKEWERLYRMVITAIEKGYRVRIIFDEVSRMSRNAEEGCALYEELFRMDVALVFLKERHINTEVYRAAIDRQISIAVSTGDAATDKFVAGIMDALNQYTIDLAQRQIRIAFEKAEAEVENLHRRTSEGLRTAQLNGKQIGRVTGRKYPSKKEKQAKEQILKLRKSFAGGNTDAEVMKIVGVARGTYYKYKRELVAEMAAEQE